MDPKTLEELQEENTKLTQENTALKEEVETVTAVNEELQQKIEELSSPKTIAEATEKAAKEKPVLPTSTFTVGGQAYKFITPVFMYKKQRITAEAALKDEKLLAEIVAAELGVIAKA